MPADPSPLSRAASGALSWLGAFLLPQRCAVCGGHAGADAVCARCAADLPLPDPNACPRCGDDSSAAAVCGACLKTPPAFAATVAGFRYASPVDQLIQRFKFGGALPLGPWFGAALAAKIPPAQAAGATLIVPMPLHPQRLKERGYNQAREIAAALSRRTGLPIADRLVTRIRDTAHQADLDADARHRNLRGAFACPRPIAGRPRLLLVDDVMTTGTSLRELATTLADAGAGEMIVTVAARTASR